MADEKSEECIGYCAIGKNGFVRENGSDQSTSGRYALLDNQTKRQNANMADPDVAAIHGMFEPAVEVKPARTAYAASTIRARSHGLKVAVIGSNGELCFIVRCDPVQSFFDL